MEFFKNIGRYAFDYARSTGFLSEHDYDNPYHKIGRLSLRAEYKEIIFFLEHEWPREFDLWLFGFQSCSVFESYCSYSVSAQQRHYYLHQYYFKITKNLLEEYTKLRDNLSYLFLDQHAQTHVEQDIAELQDLHAHFVKILKDDAQYQLPTTLVAFHEIFVEDKRCTFVWRNHTQQVHPQRFLLASLPVISDPQYEGIFRAANKLKMKSQQHKEKQEKQAATLALRPYCLFSGSVVAVAHCPHSRKNKGEVVIKIT